MLASVATTKHCRPGDSDSPDVQSFLLTNRIIELFNFLSALLECWSELHSGLCSMYVIDGMVLASVATGEHYRPLDIESTATAQ